MTKEGSVRNACVCQIEHKYGSRTELCHVDLQTHGVHNPAFVETIASLPGFGMAPEGHLS
jgi:hypothetical protein